MYIFIYKNKIFMENTINLKLPLLISNQSQKEITHNEALTIIDNILQNGIIDKDLATPPSSPNSNDLYIIGTSATGTWANKDGYLAFYEMVGDLFKPGKDLHFGSMMKIAYIPIMEQYGKRL